MKFTAGNIYHVYNEGNNRQPLFITNEDYLAFLGGIRNTIHTASDIISYTLMPNHFHLIIASDERSEKQVTQGGLILDTLTNKFRELLSQYAKSFNDRYSRSGSLFRQKTKSKCLSTPFDLQPPWTVDDIQQHCFHYIHQNPLHAGLVNKLEDWQFSSYPDFAGLRNDTLCNKELAAKYCSYQPSTFKTQSLLCIPEEIIPHIYQSKKNNGLPHLQII